MNSVKGLFFLNVDMNSVKGLFCLVVERLMHGVENDPLFGSHSWVMYKDPFLY